MMLMGYWSCAVQPGTAMTAHGDDEVRRHKGCRTFLLRPRAPRPSDPELPHAEANLPTRYPTHRKQRGGRFCRHREPGYRHADFDAEETEHQALASRERAQDLRRWNVCACWLHRWLRQRESQRRRCDDRLHRGHINTGMYDRPALFAAQYAAQSPA